MNVKTYAGVSANVHAEAAFRMLCDAARIADGEIDIEITGGNIELIVDGQVELTLENYRA